MKIEKLSCVAQDILDTLVGYRNDSLYTGGYEDFVTVLEHEIFELGNEDILETIQELYTDIDLTNDIEYSVEKIKDYFFDRFDTNELYVKWLTTKRAVVRLYEGNPTAYILNNDALVLSDLDIDGVLFISAMPFNVV